MRRPWLKGLAGCHFLERINDPKVVKGPALVRRGIEHKTRDLGIKVEDLEAGARVHPKEDKADVKVNANLGFYLCHEAFTDSLT